jgi:hypothetical protein
VWASFLDFLSFFVFLVAIDPLLLTPSFGVLAHQNAVSLPLVCFFPRDLISFLPNGNLARTPVGLGFRVESFNAC